MLNLNADKLVIPQDALLISEEEERAWDTTQAFETLRQQYAETIVAPIRRRKLWELKTSLHCPVIGTCLDTDELHKLARGAGLQGRAAMSDYALHHAAVSEAAHRNPFSERMQKLLERKFDHIVKRFNKAKTDNEIIGLWQETQVRGEAAGGLWAAMTHAHISEQVVRGIFENIHMLSHQVGAQARGDQRLLGQLSDETRKLRERLQRNSERFARDMADKEQMLHFMQRRITETAAKEASYIQAERRIAELESSEDRQLLLTRIELLERQLRTTAQPKGRNVTQPTIIPINTLAKTESVSACGECDEKHSGRCGGSDLSGRSVLCVGGRAALYPEYRRVVEASGGYFLTHDGGREDSMNRLPALLARADVVVCPADCLSHSAYYAVKRYCKRFGKPCALLDRSGLSTFRKGVEAIAVAPAGAGILSFFG